MDRVSTHRLGSMCSVCKGVLIEDGKCRCGQRHGYAHQTPSPWATEHFPDHPCFQADD